MEAGGFSSVIIQQEPDWVSLRGCGTCFWIPSINSEIIEFPRQKIAHW